jgi:hypothetical protein
VGRRQYVLADGTTGQVAPAYDFATQADAGVDGAVLQQVTPQAGRPNAGAGPRRVRRAELARPGPVADARAAPPRRAGHLTAVADDGTVRTLPCYYRKGSRPGCTG